MSLPDVAETRHEAAETRHEAAETRHGAARVEGRVDQQLVQRIAAGDRRAEALLVELHSRGLRYLLLHLTRDPVLSEDLHQETFRVVLEKARAGEVHEGEKLAGFIRGTARRLVWGEFRRTARQPCGADPNDVPEPTDPAADPLDLLLAGEDRRRLRQVLGEMRSARDREVIFRFHLAGDSKEEICAALGLEDRHFNLVLHRARRRFRQLVESGANVK